MIRPTTTLLTLALVAMVALPMTGCAQQPSVHLQLLAPDVPGSTSLPALPPPGAPTPLTQRPPFGLYATGPNDATLDTLSTGTISPDGRFRTALTPQGIWVARVDGAWIWQVQLPISAPPESAPLKPGTHPSTRESAQLTPPRQPVPVGAPSWTPRSTLLIRDDAGSWHEAEPVAAQVLPLAASLQGKERVTLSPDGKQLLYYAPGKAGRQLWVAGADGSNPKLMGENVTGSWAADNTLQVHKPTAAPAGTRSTPPELGPQ